MARITTAVLAILLAGPASLGIAKAQDVPAASVEPLLSTGETVLGQTITYPTATAAHVTAVIVTLPPGAETGWHQHDVPLFGYLLEGQLTVDYEGVGERIYRPGAR